MILVMIKATLPPAHIAHDVEVNYFTCGFTCHFFVFKLYAYVFTCATSKLFSQVKLHKTRSKVIYFNVVRLK